MPCSRLTVSDRTATSRMLAGLRQCHRKSARRRAPIELGRTRPWLIKLNGDLEFHSANAVLLRPCRRSPFPTRWHLHTGSRKSAGSGSEWQLWRQ